MVEVQGYRGGVYDEIQGKRDGVYGGGTGIKKWSLWWRYRNKDGVYGGGTGIKMEFTVEVQE